MSIAKIINNLITIVKLIINLSAHAIVFLTTLVNRAGVNSITLRVKQLGSVLDTHN